MTVQLYASYSEVSLPLEALEWKPCAVRGTFARLASAVDFIGDDDGKERQLLPGDCLLLVGSGRIVAVKKEEMKDLMVGDNG